MLWAKTRMAAALCPFHVNFQRTKPNGFIFFLTSHIPTLPPLVAFPGRTTGAYVVCPSVCVGIGVWEAIFHH